MLNLQADLNSVGSTQAALARHLNVSRATVNLVIKYDRWPKHASGGKQAMQERICDFLIALGAPPERVAATFNEAPAIPRANAGRLAVVQTTDSGPQAETHHTEDPYMLLRHTRLTREARAHFRLLRDPFVEEMSEAEDVFLTDDIRYVRAAMRQTAKHGGMLAVIAESGGGKSTLRHDLIHWINSTGEPISVVEPYSLGVDDKAERRGGKQLLAGDIIIQLIRTLAPGTRVRAKTIDQSAQCHEILRSSAGIGRKHLLLIEEAHSLSKASIKQLKRFYELQEGFKKLLAIMLIGQTELKHKLSETDPEVREVVQRMELVELPPLDNQVEAYLRHKLARADSEFEKVFDADVAPTVRDLLRVTVTEYSRGSKHQRQRSLCYPLALNNLVSRAMNEAVRIGAPRVNGALISAVLRSPE